MRLLLIIPYDSSYKCRKGYTKLISHEPLTLTVLAALVPKEYNIEIKIVDEGMEKMDYGKQFYDIVGITATTSASKRGYELATYFKQKGSYVVMGGHHVTLMPDEATQYADTIFIGTSEITWPQFLHDYMKGNTKKVYEQEYLSDGYIHLPIPRRDLINRNHYLKQPVIISNYSCKNKCSFCSISKFWKGCKARRPISEVIEEIKSLKSKQFIFLDPNQYSDKEYSTELYDELIKLKIRWVGLATSNITDDVEMLNLMAKSGCKGLFIGFESLDQNNLQGVGKTPNKVQDYQETIRKLHDLNITVTGSFVLGFDSDTKESLLSLPEQIASLKLDLMNFGILTPFPNTGIYHQMEKEGRLLTKDWSLYDSMHCVYQPQNMSKDELEEIFVKVWKECYTYKRILSRLNYTQDMKLVKLLSGVGFRNYINQLERVLEDKDF